NGCVLCIFRHTVSKFDLRTVFKNNFQKEFLNVTCSDVIEMTKALHLLLLLVALSAALAFPTDCPTAGEQLLPHDSDCSLYYQCVHGSKVVRNCAPGTHFDFKLQICNWPFLVNCKQAPTITTTTQSSATTKVTPSIDGVEKLPNGCPADFGTHLLLPHETDCAKYYTCNNGDRILMRCAAGTLFNVNLQLCDWPDSVNCNQQATIPTTSSPVTTTYLPLTTTHSPLSTTNSPLTTTSPRGTEQPTPATTSDNDKNDNDNEPPTNEIDKFPNGCPVNHYIHLLLPHEHDCAKFYACDHGRKILRDCAQGTLFDVQLQVCNFPHLVNCNATATTTVKTTSSEAATSVHTPTTNKDEDIDEDLKETAIESTISEAPSTKEGEISTTGITTEPSSTTDYKYITTDSIDDQTTSGSTDGVTKNVTTTLDYNTPSGSGTTKDTDEASTTDITNAIPDVTSTQAAIENSSTTERSDNTTMPPTTSSSPVTPICSPGTFGNVPHPELCNSFYMCAGGTATQLFCSSGFEFDPQRRTCVPIAPGGCTLGSMTTGPPVWSTTTVLSTSNDDQTESTGINYSTTPSIIINTVTEDEDNITVSSITPPAASTITDNGSDRTTLETNSTITTPSSVPSTSYFGTDSTNTAETDTTKTTAITSHETTSSETDRPNGTSTVEPNSSTNHVSTGSATQTTTDVITTEAATELPTRQTTDSLVTDGTTREVITTEGSTEPSIGPDNTTLPTTTIVSTTPEVTGSYSTIETDVTTISPTTSSSPAPPICSPGTFGNVPHPELCNSFFMCAGGTATQLFCSSGFEFDRERRTCVPIAPGGCTLGSVTTGPPVWSTTTVLSTSNNDQTESTGNNYSTTPTASTATEDEDNITVSSITPPAASTITDNGSDLTTLETNSTITTPSSVPSTSSFGTESTNTAETDTTKTTAITSNETTLSETDRPTETSTVEPNSSTYQVSTGSATQTTTDVITTEAATELPTRQTTDSLVTDGTTTEVITTEGSTESSIGSDNTTLPTTTIVSTTPEVTGSYSTIETDVRTISPTTSSSPAPPICPPGTFGNIPHPELCNSFFMCAGGTATQLFCSSGFEFDRERRTCVPIAPGGCTLGSVTTGPPVWSTTTVVSTSNNDQTESTGTNYSTTPSISTVTEDEDNITVSSITPPAASTITDNGSDLTTLETNSTTTTPSSVLSTSSFETESTTTTETDTTRTTAITSNETTSSETDRPTETSTGEPNSSTYEVSTGSATQTTTDVITTEAATELPTRQTTDSLVTDGTTWEVITTEGSTESSIGPDNTTLPTTTIVSTTPEVTGSYSTIETDVTTIAPTTSSSPAPPICPPGTFGNVPHSELCNSFFMCAGGTATQLFCSSGFEFDREKRTCVPIAPGGCTLGSVTTGSPVWSTTTELSTSNNDQTESTGINYSTTPSVSTVTEDEDNITVSSITPPAASTITDNGSDLTTLETNSTTTTPSSVPSTSSFGTESTNTAETDITKTTAITSNETTSSETDRPNGTSTVEPNSSTYQISTGSTTQTTTDVITTEAATETPTRQTTDTLVTDGTTREVITTKGSTESSIGPDNTTLPITTVVSTTPEVTGLYSTTEADITTIAPTTSSSPAPPICPPGTFGNIPHPELCNSFFMCAGGIATQLFCSSGFEFDRERRTCVAIAPGGCSMSTVAPFGLSKNEERKICPEVISTVVPHSDICNAYYVCEQGVHTQLYCSRGYEFDSETKRCELISAGGCSQKKSKDANINENATILDVRSITTDSLCENEPDDNLLPHLEKCNAFYKCSNGKALELFCEEGLEFNHNTKACIPISGDGCTSRK
ncbi:unnamed protein product, partial [Chilo suppressalis]